LRLAATLKRHYPLEPLDEKRRYSVKLTCAYLDVSHARLYEKIARGELEVIKDGRRTYIPGTEIARLCRAGQ
jgi:hypothetical protein